MKKQSELIKDLSKHVGLSVIEQNLLVNWFLDNNYEISNKVNKKKTLFGWSRDWEDDEYCM